MKPADHAAVSSRSTLTPALAKIPASAPTNRSVAPPAPLALLAGARFTMQRTRLILSPLPARIQEDRVEAIRLIVGCPSDLSCTAAPPFHAGVLVQLDDQVPRWGTSPRTLQSLLPDDEELAPGFHVLTVYAAAQDKILLDVQGFVVDPVPPKRKAPGPGSNESKSQLDPQQACRVLFPRATLNGPLDRQLSLLGYLAGENNEPVSVAYEVWSERMLARGEFPQGTSAVLSDPPSGDLSIRMQCKVGEEILAEGRRVITVNPELEGGAR